MEQMDQTVTPKRSQRLYRSRTEKMIGGVAGGLGEYFALDPLWFRLGFVILALGGGSGVAIYLIAWLLIPERPTGEEPVAGAAMSMAGTAIIGVALVVLGGIALVNELLPDFGRFVWPLGLVLVGAVLLIGGVSRDTR
ncbi:MAG: PspC domain-containing protein [Acidimicrobiia bacterium]|nr:PspC domain-containing protein [Acidimicrobiia bacterium]MDH4307189.1 PspC domain-containing protein [Acidimicrobiia bacterium]MDH5294377.1 PspC domain-containing protein [Acidimicrobiia bacterium]